MSVQISTTFVLAFLALCLIGAPSGAYGQLKQNVGVVEGFYWTPSDAVNGQSGFFTFEQRLELFDVMAEGGLGVYYYAPQQVDSLGLWDANSVTKWTETATKASNLGISLVYGLRPGWLSGTWTEIHDKVQQLLDVGIHAYALNFDDAEGASSDEQKNRQVALASYLDQTFPTMNLRIFLPSEYWQTHDGPSTTKSQWAASLSIVDSGLDSSVAMGLTGHDITPSSMSTSDFPPLSSSRPKWFWDNWAAEDTSTKLPWGRISSSSNPRIDTTLFTAPSYGYVLNLAFPVERTVHQVYCLAQLIDPSITNPCTTSYLGTRWATWLSDHGFAHQHSTSSLANTLAQVIEDDPYTMTSISQLESTYPGLSGVFSTPPTPPPTASPTPTPTSGSAPPVSNTPSGSTPSQQPSSQQPSSQQPSSQQPSSQQPSSQQPSSQQPSSQQPSSQQPSSISNPPQSVVEPAVDTPIESSPADSPSNASGHLATLTFATVFVMAITFAAMF